MSLQTMTVSRFLGRLLGLDTELQTTLFDYFSNTLDGAGTPPQHGLSSNKMALITSGCGAMRSPSTKWP